MFLEPLACGGAGGWDGSLQGDGLWALQGLPLQDMELKIAWQERWKLKLLHIFVFKISLLKSQIYRQQDLPLVHSLSRPQ